MRKAVGMRRTQTPMPIMSMAVRQSVKITSWAAIGATVMGAMPMPAETRETARLRRVSNQPVTVAMRGGKMAPPAAPTRRPKMSWKAKGVGARLARARPRPRRVLPESRTMRGPKRSTAMPQRKLAIPMATKETVMAAEISVRDQPVSCAIGCRKTGRAKIDPMAMQPMKAPAATMTQR
jgi:hypothetical protein